MHIHHDHVGCNCGDHHHDHEHAHTHEHTHDGHTHTHEHCHSHEHEHGAHPHNHDHLHGHDHHHDHDHDCGCTCGSCATKCEHTPMEELVALMKYMVGHNAAHAQELAELAEQLDKAGSHAAFEQVMAAVCDFEKGNMRLTAVLSALDIK